MKTYWFITTTGKPRRFYWVEPNTLPRASRKRMRRTFRKLKAADNLYTEKPPQPLADMQSDTSPKADSNQVGNISEVL